MKAPTLKQTEDHRLLIMSFYDALGPKTRRAIDEARAYVCPREVFTKGVLRMGWPDDVLAETVRKNDRRLIAGMEKERDSMQGMYAPDFRRPHIPTPMQDIPMKRKPRRGSAAWREEALEKIKGRLPQPRRKEA